MGSSKIRMPVVAGQFYPASCQQLKNQIKSFITPGAEKKDALACMLPHAGYMYSGRVAAETVSHLNLKSKIILLGPNHTGQGASYSIMTEGSWETPLGEVNIDSPLANKILEHSKFLEDDTLAHLDEHSLEVELPILQYFKTDFEIVPIAFLADDLESLKAVGREISKAIQDLSLKDSVLLVASSDMTHYESQSNAQKKDQEAITAILELNEDKLMERIRRFNISMCGYAPTIVMLSAAKSLGAKKAELIRYQTSGDVTGDKESVVGYAGIIIF